MSEAIADKPVGWGRRGYLAVEFLLVFWGLPLAYRLELVPLPMIPTLLLVALAAGIMLWRDPSFERKRLWNAGAFGKFRWGRNLTIFAAAAVVTLAMVWWWLPERLFGFPRTHPRFWLVVMALYPLLSVYPQELLCRAFLFHRYRTLFPGATARVVASAVAFAFLHIVFRNWPAVLLTLPAGWLFARTYERTGSLFWTCLEHGLYGDWVFTVGLGIYFYGGTVSRAAAG